MRILRVFVDREPAEKRWVALAYVLLTVTTVLGIASTALYVVDKDERAQQREQDRIELTADARYAACVNFNIEQEGDRSSVLNIALVMFGFTEAGDLSDAERGIIVNNLSEELQTRYRQVEQQAANDNPFRDCSPAGITAYYADPVPDPGTTLQEDA
jgi:hypothetical protein